MTSWISSRITSPRDDDAEGVAECRWSLRSSCRDDATYCLPERVVDRCSKRRTLQAVRFGKQLTIAASGRGCPFNAGSDGDEIV